MIASKQAATEVSRSLCDLTNHDTNVGFAALHFHLSVANPALSGYEDAEFQYTPLLDGNRDRDLLEILPDYLTEEICFPRSNAAKFYARVVDCMTKKIELVEE